MSIENELFDIANECSYDSPEFQIRYENYKSGSGDENKLTYVKPIVMITTIINKTTGQALKIPITLVNLPIETPLGYKINGTLYTAVGKDRRAPGWYIVDQRDEKKKDKSKKVSQLMIPDRGLKWELNLENGEIFMRFGVNKTKLNVGVFLKALTGKTFKELIMLLGPRNKYILSTFYKEPSRDKCIELTLMAMSEKLKNVVDEYRLQELKRRIYDKRFMNVGELRSRTERNFSFSARAYYKELAKGVLGYERGVTLTDDILRDIDSHPEIDTLSVAYEGKIYELKKYQLPEGDLSEEELLTAINMYAVALDGYPTRDSTYELDNRKAVSFNDTIRDLIESKLGSITSAVSQHFAVNGIEADLSSLDLPKMDLDDVINLIKDSKSPSAESSETTNLLAVIAKKGKIATDYKGRSTDEMVSVKYSERGIYDPYQTPESSKVGLVHYKTLGAIQDKEGTLKGAYVKIENRKRVSTDDDKNGIVYLSPREANGYYIAPWDADLTKDKVPCYHNDKVIDVSSDKIQYQEYSCFNNISLSTAEITCMNNSDGKRVLMGGNQGRQAVPTMVTSRPLVATGAYGMFAEELGGIITAEHILGKYYVDNGQYLASKGYPYEKFISYPIKLSSIDQSVPGYRTYLFSVLTGNDDSVKVSTVVPFCFKTTDNTVARYNLNFKSDRTYQGKDIVVYDHSLDITPWNLEYNVNLGHMPFDKRKVSVEMALGNNYLVAWKSFGSSNLDDGIVIRQGLLGTGKLQHFNIVQFKVDLKDIEDGVERFGFANGKPPKDFEDTGLPKVGTHVNPKDLIVVKYKEGVDGLKIDTSVRVDASTSGEVILADITDKRAVVLVASVEDAGVGDKLTGDHGNKGVIAKIVPDSQMPYLSDGRVVDIQLNPLGIPSRMNPSQLIVAALGYCMMKKGEKEGLVISPQQKDCLEYAKKMCENYGVTKEILYDGRTCTPFARPTMVGYLYMKKLTHVADSKANSTGIPDTINPTTFQPNKGKRVAGGQSIGEMEIWALLSGGVLSVINSLMSIQSDDIESKTAIDAYAKTGDESKIDNQNNNNDTALLTYTRLLGVDIVNDENGNYLPKMMTDKDISALALKPIENHKDSLQDPSMFGSLKNNIAGLPSTRKIWGYMNLNCEIIHPTWIYKSNLCSLIRLKEITTQGDSNFLEYKGVNFSKDRAQKVINGKGFIKIEGGDAFYCYTDELEEGDWKTGIEGVVELFRASKISDSIAYVKSKVDYFRDKYENVVKPNEKASYSDKLFAMEQNLNCLEMLEKDGLDFKDFIIKHFPICPRTFRVEAMGRRSDFDMYYSNIISIAEICKADKSKSTKLFNAITGFIGYKEGDGYSLDRSKSAHTVISFFASTTGKNDGYIKDNMMSKVINMSFRGVIVPAEAGSIKLHQVGIPFRFGMECMKTFIRPVLIDKFEDIANACRHSKNAIDAIMNAVANLDARQLAREVGIFYESEAQETAEELEANQIKLEETFLQRVVDEAIKVIESRPVGFGRQPTLHKLGIRSFYPKVVLFDKALHLHPLTCSGYNADFDGDQMYGWFPVKLSDAKQLYEKMSTESEMLNPKDSSFILMPTQDTILGCYEATMLHENKLRLYDSEEYTEKYYSQDKIKYYNNLENLKNDVNFRKVDYQDLVCYVHTNGNRYLSTVGRILFNSIIPGGFTIERFTNTLGIKNVKNDNYKELLFDGLVKKKKDNFKDFNTISMSEITGHLLKVQTNRGICNTMDNILEFGVTACDKSSASIGLDDYVQHPMIDDLVARCKQLVDKIDYYASIGLCTEADRRSSCSSVYSYVTNFVKRDLLNYFDRNNDLFIIMDSGSRGNLSQLAQTCGIIGEVGDSGNVVLSNYMRGLTSEEQMSISYGTRNALALVQNYTAKAGELTRNSVYTLGEFKIVERDCGNEDNVEIVQYSEDILTCTLDGEEFDIENVLGFKILPEDENYEKFLNLCDGEINWKVITFVRKNNIRTLVTDHGTVRLTYKISEMFKKLMLNRVGRDLPYMSHTSVAPVKKVNVFDGADTEDSEEHTVGIITKETIEYVEKENLEKIEMRTMLSCHSIGGVCAKCYGLKEGEGKYPSHNPQERIGITAAQSVGESATQLNLNKLNQGAGATKASPVETFKAYVNGSFPKSGVKAVMSNFNGFCTITELGENFAIVDNGVNKYKVPKNLVQVYNGEYVKKGQMLSGGVIDVSEIHMDNQLEETKMKQMTLLGIFYDLFASSDIDINIRNFECFARCQTSLARIVESDNPDFKPGSIEFLAKVLKANDPSIKYSCNAESTKVVINKYGGFLNNLSYQDISEQLARCAINPDMHSTHSRSILSKLIIGEDVLNGGTKRMPTLTYENFDSVAVSKDEDSKDSELPTLVSIDSVEAINEGFDKLDNIDIFDGLDIFGSEDETSASNNYDGVSEINVFGTDNSEDEAMVTTVKTEEKNEEFVPQKDGSDFHINIDKLSSF